MRAYGKYQLLERLGEGGMAEVFLARVPGPMGVNRYVALKRVLPHLSRDPALAEMFVDEARLAARLAHPALVHIHDFGLEEGQYFLAMELVEGTDVRQMVAAARKCKQRIPVEFVLHVAAQVARGLHYAHRLDDGQGRPLHIVHRDVSPANVLVSYSGDVKLTDFGVARAARKLSQTESGTIKGKFRYMSPEQARGDEIDQRTDLFALGAVIFEMLTLEPAFGAETEMASLHRVQQGIDVNVLRATLDGDVATVLEKALASRREDRFASGNEMADALERVLRQRDATFGAAQVSAYLETLFVDELRQRKERMRKYETGWEGSLQPFPSEDSARTHIDAATRVAITPTGSGEKANRRKLAEEAAVLRGRRLVAGAVASALIVAGAALTWKLLAHHAAPAPMVTTAAVAPAAPSFGGVIIESTPPGAKVVVDGVALPSPTPTAKNDLDPARPHTVTLALAGHREVTQTVKVRAGDVHRLALPLEALPALMVTSTPDGATVQVNDRFVGKTPVKVPVEIGQTYAVEVLRPGTQHWKRTVTVDSATPPPLHAVLADVPLSGFGMLDLSSVPWATISVDGKATGRNTPTKGLKLAAGTHKVVLTNPGLPPKTLTVSIRPNETTTKMITLE